MKRNLIIVVLLTSCFYKVTAQSPATVAPARSPFKAIASTQYTAHTELFAEFRPLLLNNPARFTAHLTQVGETFKPYTNSEVSLVLSINGKTAWEQTLKEPAAPGIYRFPIKSAEAGTGTITITLKMPDYSEKFLVENVTVYPDSATAIASQVNMKDEDAQHLVTYYKEKSWLEDFATSTIQLSGGKLWIPQSAVIVETGRSYIYVQEDPEHFKKQLIKTGAKKNDLIEVKEGIKAGERIVTIGADKVGK